MGSCCAMTSSVPENILDDPEPGNNEFFVLSPPIPNAGELHIELLCRSRNYLQ
jgi:hypothetical protein